MCGSRAAPREPSERSLASHAPLSCAVLQETAVRGASRRLQRGISRDAVLYGTRQRAVTAIWLLWCLAALMLARAAASADVTAFPNLPALVGAALAAPSPPPAPPPPAVAINATSGAGNSGGTAAAGGTPSWVLPPLALVRSLLSVGADGALASAAAALASRRCLTVVVLGGSVSLGSSLGGSHPDRPRGPEDSYPALLKPLLDAAFPCTDRPGGHAVLNRGVYAVASDWWADKLAEALHVGAACGARTPFPGGALLPPQSQSSSMPSVDLNSAAGVAQLCADLAEAHLVLVDTSVNDAFDLVNIARDGNMKSGVADDQALGSEADARRSATLTELIVHLLLSALPAADGAAMRGTRGVVFVGTSSHGGPWAGGLPRRSDMAAPQAAVCARYGIPFVSAVDALGPFDTAARAAWWSEKFRSDGCCHPTASGHAIIARLVMHCLAVHAAPGGIPGAAAPLGKLPPPALASATDLEMYLRGHPLRIALFRAAPAASRGFAPEQETPGKPGLVAHIVGDAVAFAIRLPLAAERARVGVLHVHLLRSASRLGLCRVDVTLVTRGNANCVLPPSPNATLAAPPPPPDNATPPQVLASRVLDGLWSTNATELSVEAMPLSPEALRAAAAAPGGADGLLCVTFSIEAATPPRDLNKVKLTSLVLF
jgi:hypothetical protein